MLAQKNTAVAQKLIRFNQEAEERDAQRRAVKEKKPYLNLITTPIEVNALPLVPMERAKSLEIATINIIGRRLIVAVFDFSREGIKEEVERLEREGYKLEIFIVSKSGLNHAWSFYTLVQKKGEEVVGRVEIDKGRLKELKDKLNNLDDFEKVLRGVNYNEVVVTEFLEIILGGAMALAVSDVHFEPTRSYGGLRFRLDGVMREVIGKEMKPIPNELYRRMVARVKLLSGLKLNITNETQDGRFTIKAGEDLIEVRVAVAPAEFGEVVVLRILDPKAIRVGLTELGLREDDLRKVRNYLKQPNGMMLNTGPTGSGKTTTLYAFLREVAKPEVKVITVEDPIEYHLEGIEQTQVDTEAKYTFASGLKSILRQDPDVILVGEIRDEETAAMAINAALTGHLVFSTLHTNNASGAIPRLVDLAVSSGVIGPALNLVIAQRLVRKLCEVCAVEVEIREREKKYLEKIRAKLPTGARGQLGMVKKIKMAGEDKKCQGCNGTGYKGRVGIFELFEVKKEVKEMIEKNHAVADILRLARAQGMITMQEDGMIKVVEGVTSVEEVERVTGTLET